MQCSVRTRSRPGGIPCGTPRDKGKLKEGDPGSPKCMLGEEPSPAGSDEPVVPISSS